jgi:hypothetical protein
MIYPHLLSTESDGNRELSQTGVLPSLAGEELPGSCNTVMESPYRLPLQGLFSYELRVILAAKAACTQLIVITEVDYMTSLCIHP